MMVINETSGMRWEGEVLKNSWRSLKTSMKILYRDVAAED
jgi:hypothetical protein